MLTSPASAAPPTTSTITSSAAPSSPPSSRRLRGLSYLRSYTQHHLHGHSNSSSHSNTTTTTTTTPSSHPPLPSPPPPPASNLLSPTTSTRSAASGSTEQPNAHTGGASQETSTTQQGAGTREQQPAWFSSAVGLTAAPSRPAVERSPAASPPPHTPSPPLSLSAQPLSITSGNMTRNRAQTDGAAQLMSTSPAALDAQCDSKDGVNAKSQLPTIRFVPHQDPRAARPSLIFPPITRTLPTANSVIRVGRYSERDSTTEPSNNTPSSAPVGFKSKVVSRRHCELWCEEGQWYIKDVRSSSGTFLNHIRLSQPGAESDKFKIKDGDVIQLGIDFRGGEEMIFRCVKIRVECNRGWQRGINEFNKSTHQQLQKLAKHTRSESKKSSADNTSTHSSECAICLMSIAPCQSLFVAPCSHVWHYKCIRKLLNGPTYPIFLCPNCRAVADLEADVDEPEGEWEDAPGDLNGPPTPRQLSDLEVPEDGTSSEEVAPNEHQQDQESDPNDIEEVSRRMSHISLLPGPVSDRIPPFDPDHLDSSEPEHAEASGASQVNSATSDPVPVPIRVVNGDLLEAGLPSGFENPMTPRNDAGPFILDGGAGQLPAAGASRTGSRQIGSMG